MEATAAPAAGLPLAPGVTTIHFPPGEEGAVRLRRFAAGYPLRAEGVPGRSTTRLFIPDDRSQRPWRLRVEPAQGTRVCDPR